MPEPNDYQVLVQMVACGICNGTDMKLINRKFKGFTTYPAVLGHEGVGRIVRKGRKVTSFRVGDHILKPTMYGSIDGCYGGHGGFAEYGLANDCRALVRDGYGVGEKGFRESDYTRQVLPADFDPVSSVMINTFGEVLSAVRRFGFDKGQSVVVFGSGSVGQSFTRMAKLLGLGPITACDIDDHKLEIARGMGADCVINCRREDVREIVRRICPDGVDYVVDAVGYTDIINQGMELVKFNGKTCVYGISGDMDMNLDWRKAPLNWMLQFIQLPTYKEEAAAFSQIVDWIRNGMLVQEDFITDVVDFDDVLDAFDLVKQGKAGKTIVTFRVPDDSVE